MYGPTGNKKQRLRSRRRQCTNPPTGFGERRKLTHLGSVLGGGGGGGRGRVEELEMSLGRLPGRRARGEAAEKRQDCGWLLGLGWARCWIEKMNPVSLSKLTSGHDREEAGLRSRMPVAGGEENREMITRTEL